MRFAICYFFGCGVSVWYGYHKGHEAATRQIVDRFSDILHRWYK